MRSTPCVVPETPLFVPDEREYEHVYKRIQGVPIGVNGGNSPGPIVFHVPYISRAKKGRGAYKASLTGA